MIKLQFYKGDYMKLIRLSLVFLFFIFSSINAQDFLNTPPKLIGDQFGFTEGPLWIQSEKLWLLQTFHTTKFTV